MLLAKIKLEQRHLMSVPVIVYVKVWVTLCEMFLLFYVGD